MNKKEKSDAYLNFEKYFLKNTKSKIGVSIILFFSLVAIFADFIAPYEPLRIQFGMYVLPNRYNLLGTTSYGQDIFSQVVYGARVSISVGILAGVLSSAIGVIVGLISGYLGGKIGNILMRIVDVLLVIPSLALMIVLAAYLPRMGIFNLVIIIGCLSWLWTARSIRAQTLSESHREYVDAAKALGKSNTEIMFSEILPNIIPIVTANMVMVITQAVLMEATLSFLGLGDPSMISWGQMLSLAFANGAIIRGAWYWMLPPGFCIATLGFSFMLIGNSFLDIYAKDRGGSIRL